MRSVGRPLLLLGACSIAVSLALAGCGKQVQTPVGELRGGSLEEVTERVSESSLLLIQDASPRIGLEAQYAEDSYPDRWAIVALCADAPSLEGSETVEVAVVPEESMSEHVLLSDLFEDAVACEGLAFR